MNQQTLDIDEFLRYVKTRKSYNNQIVHVEHFPPKPAEFGALDIPLHLNLMNWLIERGMHLWIHQAEALNQVLKGKNIIIATSTSSGKSLCYNLPVLNSILEDPYSTALYIFPRKALTQDQSAELKKISEEGNMQGINIGIYDGDTSSEEKRSIRNNANIILTNPYALHLYLSYFQKLWSRFCKNLKYVIIDEVHLYKGVFGSNVALLLRRLKRILKTFGISPQWILCSATINDPKGFAEKLVGEPFHLVDNDGSPSGAKKVILWDLLWDDYNSKYRSCSYESRKLFKYHLEREIQTLLFTRTRKSAELQNTWARSALPHLRDKIQTYRAGFNKEDRRKIEKGLKNKELLGVCSTNALELGIDVGSLQATISSGFPQTISSFKQQIGRSGRGEKISISTLIPQENPLDFYYIHNPRALFGPVQEKLLINLKNKQILKKQLRCAAVEQPIFLQEHETFGLDDPLLFNQCLEELVSESVFKRTDDIYYSTETQPSQNISLDNLSEGTYKIFIGTKEDNLYLTSDDEEHVYKDNHPGAIYLYNAKQFLVDDVDFEKKEVYMSKVNVDYYTIAIYTTEIKRITEVSTKRIGKEFNVDIYFGKVRVKQTTNSFAKINSKNQKVIETEEISMPPLEFNTEAIWVVIPNSHETQLVEKGFDFEGSLHAMEHALVNVVPIQAQIDRYDIEGVYSIHDSDYQKSLIYIFDAFKDGIGISERIYETINDLIISARELIKKCPCTSKTGCPACIMSNRCSKFNECLDKKGALALLDLLIENEIKAQKSIKEIFETEVKEKDASKHD